MNSLLTEKEIFVLTGMTIWLVLKLYRSKTPFAEMKASCKFNIHCSAMHAYKQAWTPLGSVTLTLGTNAPSNKSFPRGSVISRGKLEILQIAAWFMGTLSTGLPSNGDQKLTIRLSWHKGYSFWILNPGEVDIYIFSMVMTANKWSMWHISHLWLCGAFLLCFVFVQIWPSNFELERKY